MIIQQLLPKAVPITISRTRRVLGIAWVAFSTISVYNMLDRSVPQLPLYCIGTLVVWLAAWAMMENKRWGRLTIMGVSAFVNIDLSIASFELYRAPAPVQNAILAGKPVNTFVANPYHLGTNFGIGLLLLCLFSSIWLSLPRIRDSFDEGKRLKSTKLQSVIASVLLFVLLLGFAENGLARDIRRTVNIQKSSMSRYRIHLIRPRMRNVCA